MISASFANTNPNGVFLIKSFSFKFTLSAAKKKREWKIREFFTDEFPASSLCNHSKIPNMGKADELVGHKYSKLSCLLFYHAFGASTISVPLISSFILLYFHFSRGENNSELFSCFIQMMYGIWLQSVSALPQEYNVYPRGHDKMIKADSNTSLTAPFSRQKRAFLSGRCFASYDAGKASRKITLQVWCSLWFEQGELYWQRDSQIFQLLTSTLFW